MERAAIHRLLGGNTHKEAVVYLSHQDQEPRGPGLGQMCVQNNDWVNMETNAQPSMDSFGLFPVSSLTLIQKNHEKFHDYHDNSSQ